MVRPKCYCTFNNQTRRLDCVKQRCGLTALLGKGLKAVLYKKHCAVPYEPTTRAFRFLLRCASRRVCAGLKENTVVQVSIISLIKLLVSWSIFRRNTSFLIVAPTCEILGSRCIAVHNYYSPQPK